METIVGSQWLFNPPFTEWDIENKKLIYQQSETLLFLASHPSYPDKQLAIVQSANERFGVQSFPLFHPERKTNGDRLYT